MNRSFGYVTRRRRHGRTARRRRRNRHEETLDRLFGLGRFQRAAERQEWMNWGQRRAEIEEQYQTAIGRLQLQNMPEYQPRNNAGNIHNRMRGNIIDPAYISTSGPTAPHWTGYWQINRASMPGPMADNVRTY